MNNQIKNIKNNSLANSFGFFVNMAVQFLTVAVCVRYWGVGEYGKWVLLYSIPAYIGLADFGVSSVAAYLLVPLHVNEHTKEFNRVVFNCYLIIIIAAVSALLLIIITKFFKIEFSENVVQFVFYSILCIFSKLPVAIIRSIGKYAEITYINDIAIFLEVVVMLVVVVCGGGIQDAISSMIFSRIIINIVFLRIMIKNIGVNFINIENLNFDSVKFIVKSSVGSLIITLSQLISIQGFILLTGWLVSYSSVAVLNPLRTVSKVFLQIIGVISRAAMPEISAAKASNGSSKNIKDFVNKWTYLILIPGSIVSVFLGPIFIDFWTGGKIIINHLDMLIMAVATVFSGMSSVELNSMMAENSHHRISYLVLILNTIGIAIGCLAANFYGITGVLFSIFFVEFSVYLGIKLNIFSERV